MYSVLKRFTFLSFLRHELALLKGLTLSFHKRHLLHSNRFYTCYVLIQNNDCALHFQARKMILEKKKNPPKWSFFVSRHSQSLL